MQRHTRIRFRTVAQPDREPVTLAEALVQARVDSDEEQAILTGYLVAARQWCEAHMGRPILPTAVEAEIEEWPREGGLLLDAPIITVDEVRFAYSGSTGVWNDFVLRRQPGGEKLLRPATGASWPSLGDDPVITIEGTAGFDGEVPEPIRLAILQLAAHWFAVREPVSIGNMPSEIAFTVKTLLAPWRWRLIG